MSPAATRRQVRIVSPSLAERIARLKRQLSYRLFADEDTSAREHGWEIAKTTGRFGFGARSYRDRRFSPNATTARSGPECTHRRADER